MFTLSAYLFLGTHFRTAELSNFCAFCPLASSSLVQKSTPLFQYDSLGWGRGMHALAIASREMSSWLLLLSIMCRSARCSAFTVLK